MPLWNKFVVLVKAKPVEAYMSTGFVLGVADLTYQITHNFPNDGIIPDIYIPVFWSVFWPGMVPIRSVDVLRKTFGSRNTEN